MSTKSREETSQLPAVRQETQLAFQEAKSMVRKAFVTAIKTNLAFLACSGMYAYRSGQRFWEQKGSSWWAKSRAFSKTAYLALQEDAFGSDIVIETLDIDRVLEEGKHPSRPLKGFKRPGCRKNRETRGTRKIQDQSVRAPAWAALHT
jgi:hypothetical protein